LVLSQDDPVASDEPRRARDFRHEFVERSRESVSVGDRGLDDDCLHGAAFLAMKVRRALSGVVRRGGDDGDKGKMVLKPPGAANQATKTVAGHCGRKDVRQILTAASTQELADLAPHPARRRRLVTRSQPRQSQRYGAQLMLPEALHEYAAVGALLPLGTARRSAPRFAGRQALHRHEAYRYAGGGERTPVAQCERSKRPTWRLCRSDETRTVDERDPLRRASGGGG
jgi:hypothetical protein